MNRSQKRQMFRDAGVHRSARKGGRRSNVRQTQIDWSKYRVIEVDRKGQPK